MKFDKFLKKKQNYGNLTKIVEYWPNYRIWPKLYLLKFHSNVQNFSSPAYTKLLTVFIIMTFNMHLNVMLPYPIPKYPIRNFKFFSFVSSELSILINYFVFLFLGEKKENFKQIIDTSPYYFISRIIKFTLKINIYLTRFMLNLMKFLKYSNGSNFFLIKIEVPGWWHSEAHN